jgi:molecular chaperone GrpE
LTAKEIKDEIEEQLVDENSSSDGKGGSEHQETVTSEPLADMPRDQVPDNKTRDDDGDNVETAPEDRETVELLQKDLAKTTERLMRQAAEFQNYRRRTEQEKTQMVSFGKGLVIQALLDVFDDFQRSIDAAAQSKHESKTDAGVAFESLKSGVELAYQKLMDELKKMGVEPIESVGQPFDEELHEAIMQQPVPEHEEIGIIVSEVQRGFRMGEKVLRHARVVVSSSSQERA